MEYKIIFETSVENLENQVRGFLENGWEPLGGVSVSETLEHDVGVFSRDEYSMSFVQAMIKRK